MIRGTTPTFTFKIKSEDIDLNEASNIYVTLEQGSNTIEKTGDDLVVDTRTVSVWLTQQESLNLSENIPLNVQINWTYLDEDGETIRRAATKVKSINITKQLLKRVIE